MIDGRRTVSEQITPTVRDEDQLEHDERALLKTVASVVGSPARQTIRLTDNFFDVGGNSLNAISVVTRMRDQGLDLGNVELAARTHSYIIVYIDGASAQILAVSWRPPI